MDATTLVISLFALVISYIIIYFLIKGSVESAVKSVLEDQRRALTVANRLKIKQMLKEGFSLEELRNLYLLKPEQFWAELDKQNKQSSEQSV